MKQSETLGSASGDLCDLDVLRIHPSVGIGGILPLVFRASALHQSFFLQPETGTDVVIQMPSHGSFTKEAKMLFFWWLAFWPQKYEKHWMDADKQIVEAGSGPHSTKEPFTYGGCPKTQRIPDKVACAVCV